MLARLASAVLAMVLVACSTTGVTPSPSESLTPTPVPPDDTSSPAASDTPPAEAELPAPEISSIRWATTESSPAFELPLRVAVGLDIDEKYGLDIEFVNLSGGGSDVIQAMVAGQADAGGQSGGPVISSLLTDAPLLIHYVTRHHLTDVIYGQGDVQDADDLRGQSIAISSFGASSHAGVLLAIESLGLTEADVTITQIGNDAARLAALQSGAVGAAILDSAREGELTELGFNVLVKLGDLGAEKGVPQSTFTTTVEFAEQYPNTVLNMVAMLLEGSVEMRVDFERTAEILAEQTGQTQEEALADVTDQLDGPFYPIDGRCDPEIMEFTKQVLLTVNPDLETVDPNEACSNQFLDALEDLGFQQMIGVPGY